MAAQPAQVNINQASLPALESVFHSRKRANQIVNTRELLGDFNSWDEVKERLTGIDDAVIEAWREAGVTVGSGRTHSREPRLGAAKHSRAAPRARS